MKLFEMEGFLHGKCIPRDLKVNETNAEYLVRKFGELESKLETALRECRSAGITIDNLEAKCAALAAENAGLKAVESNLVRNIINDLGDTEFQYEKVKTPATDAFLAEVRAQGVTEYSSKRGFSFQHGSIHAHFGTGDVMVGSVTFENGDAGINFAPVREKTGGVGTHYEWTKGKTAEQVDSVFVIASSNAEGLEVIRDKLSEAIAQLRKGVQS